MNRKQQRVSLIAILFIALSGLSSASHAWPSGETPAVFDCYHNGYFMKTVVRSANCDPTHSAIPYNHPSHEWHPSMYHMKANHSDECVITFEMR